MFHFFFFFSSSGSIIRQLKYLGENQLFSQKKSRFKKTKQNNTRQYQQFHCKEADGVSGTSLSREFVLDGSIRTSICFMSSSS